MLPPLRHDDAVTPSFFIAAIAVHIVVVDDFAFHADVSRAMLMALMLPLRPLRYAAAASPMGY